MALWAAKAKAKMTHFHLATTDARMASKLHVLPIFCSLLLACHTSSSFFDFVQSRGGVLMLQDAATTITAFIRARGEH
jgi:hypothetical protein